MRLTYAAGPLSMVVFCVACGPTAREPGAGGPDAGGRPDAAAAGDARPTADAPGAIDAAPCGQIAVTFRDFHDTHPDMQHGVGIDFGLVEPLLGADAKPVYQPLGPTTTVSGAASFDQWYRDVPGVNVATTAMLPLVESPPGTFRYVSESFFPMDGLGFGNESNNHNFHFTSEIHTTFTYHGGETFEFNGDDDVFVFVNGHLGIDLGGVHDPLTQTIDFDARAAELGITTGTTYALDVFHAERHTVSSTFKMATTIDCFIVE